MLTRYKVGTIKHNRSYYDLLVGNGFFKAMFTLFEIAFCVWYGIKSKWPGAAQAFLGELVFLPNTISPKNACGGG